MESVGVKFILRVCVDRWMVDVRVSIITRNSMRVEDFKDIARADMRRGTGSSLSLVLIRAAFTIDRELRCAKVDPGAVPPSGGC